MSMSMIVEILFASTRAVRLNQFTFALQALMVDENLMKLEVKRLRDNLTTRSGDVLTHEKRKLQLETVCIFIQLIPLVLYANWASPALNCRLLSTCNGDHCPPQLACCMLCNQNSLQRYTKQVVRKEQVSWFYCIDSFFQLIFTFLLCCSVVLFVNFLLFLLLVLLLMLLLLLLSIKPIEVIDDVQRVLRFPANASVPIPPVPYGIHGGWS